MIIFLVTVIVSLIPRPFEEEKGPGVHTVCACSITLTLGHWIILYTCPFTNPCVCVLRFAAGHLPFEPLLFHYKQFSFVKYCCLCALQAITKDTDIKKTGELANMLPRLLLGN